MADPFRAGIVPMSFDGTLVLSGTPTRGTFAGDPIPEPSGESIPETVARMQRDFHERRTLRFDDQDPALGLLPFSIRIADLVAAAEMLRVRVQVIDTRTGTPTEIIFSEPLAPPECRVPRRVQVRAALLRMLAHELDECLVDERGETVFEAHTPDGASVPPLLPFELEFGREKGGERG